MLDGNSEREDWDSKVSICSDLLKIPLVDPRTESSTVLSGEGVSVSGMRPETLTSRPFQH